MSYIRTRFSYNHMKIIQIFSFCIFQIATSNRSIYDDTASKYGPIRNEDPKYFLHNFSLELEKEYFRYPIIEESNKSTFICLEVSECSVIHFMTDFLSSMSEEDRKSHYFSCFESIYEGKKKYRNNIEDLSYLIDNSLFKKETDVDSQEIYNEERFSKIVKNINFENFEAILTDLKQSYMNFDDSKRIKTPDFFLIKNNESNHKDISELQSSIKNELIGHVFRAKECFYRDFNKKINDFSKKDAEQIVNYFFDVDGSINKDINEEIFNLEADNLISYFQNKSIVDSSGVVNADFENQFKILTNFFKIVTNDEWDSYVSLLKSVYRKGRNIYVIILSGKESSDNIYKYFSRNGNNKIKKETLLYYEVSDCKITENINIQSDTIESKETSDTEIHDDQSLKDNLEKNCEIKYKKINRIDFEKTSTKFKREHEFLVDQSNGVVFNFSCDKISIKITEDLKNHKPVIQDYFLKFEISKPGSQKSESCFDIVFKNDEFDSYPIKVDKNDDGVIRISGYFIKEFILGLVSNYIEHPEILDFSLNAAKFLCSGPCKDIEKNTINSKVICNKELFMNFGERKNIYTDLIEEFKNLKSDKVSINVDFTITNKGCGFRKLRKNQNIGDSEVLYNDFIGINDKKIKNENYIKDIYTESMLGILFKFKFENIVSHAILQISILSKISESFFIDYLNESIKKIVNKNRQLFDKEKKVRFMNFHFFEDLLKIKKLHISQINSICLSNVLYSDLEIKDKAEKIYEVIINEIVQNLRPEIRESVYETSCIRLLNEIKNLVVNGFEELMSKKPKFENKSKCYLTMSLIFNKNGKNKKVLEEILKRTMTAGLSKKFKK